MAVILTFANQKGGVAKTTSTINIGAALALMGKRTLLIDIDPQASLTISAGLEPTELKGIFDILDKGEPINNCIHKTMVDNLFLIPSVIDLAALEMKLMVKPAREKIIERMIAQVKGEYDFVLIDSPPQLGIMTINGLCAADSIIIPVKTDYLAYRGLTQLGDTIEELKENVRPDINIAGVIATMFDVREKEDNTILDALKEDYKVIGIVKRAAAAKKGVYDGLPVVVTEPKSQPSAQYHRIAEMIIHNNFVNADL